MWTARSRPRTQRRAGVGNPENKVFDSPRADSSPQSVRASALADVLGDVYRYVLTRPLRSEGGPARAKPRAVPRTLRTQSSVSVRRNKKRDRCRAVPIRSPTGD